MNTSSADEILTAFEQRLAKLAELLDKEREALRLHQVEQLAAITAEKQAACESLAAEAFSATLPELIKAAPDGVREQLELRHTSALTLAQQVRDSNLVNGKILHRSQKSISDLLNILSGKPLDGLYGTSGQTVAARDSKHAIAKA